MKPLFSVIQCLMAFTALPAAAQPAPPLPILELARHLELAPGQQEQLHQILAGRRAVLEAKHLAAGQARRALQAAMAEPDTSAAALRTLCAAEAQAHQEELLEQHALLRAAVALLTPAQLLNYRRAQADMPLILDLLDRVPGRRGPGGPPPPEHRRGEGPEGFRGMEEKD